MKKAYRVWFGRTIIDNRYSVHAEKKETYWRVLIYDHVRHEIIDEELVQTEYEAYVLFNEKIFKVINKEV